MMTITTDCCRNALALAMALVAACTPAPQQTDTTPSDSPPPAPQPTSPSASRQDTLPASADVELTLDKTSYAAAAPVRMTIRSRTADTLGFNPCNRLIERQESARWTKYDEPTRMCTMELWLLEPQATRSATTELPAAIPQGTYRIVLLLSRQKTPPANAPPNWGTVKAVSASFTVQ
jgi:hypothetical protein